MRIERARRRQRAARKFVVDGVDHVRMNACEAPAEDDEAWIEDVDQRGKADAQPAADVVQRAERGTGARPRPRG